MDWEITKSDTRGARCPLECISGIPVPPRTCSDPSLPTSLSEEPIFAWLLEKAKIDQKIAKSDTRGARCPLECISGIPVPPRTCSDTSLPTSLSEEPIYAWLLEKAKMDGKIT